MKVESKYEPNEFLFFMSLNKVVRHAVQSITFPVVYYKLVNDGNPVQTPMKEVEYTFFSTRINSSAQVLTVPFSFDPLVDCILKVKESKLFRTRQGLLDSL
jgi:hypothetical protein